MIITSSVVESRTFVFSSLIYAHYPAIMGTDLSNRGSILFDDPSDLQPTSTGDWKFLSVYSLSFSSPLHSFFLSFPSTLFSLSLSPFSLSPLHSIPYFPSTPFSLSPSSLSPCLHFTHLLSHTHSSLFLSPSPFTLSHSCTHFPLPPPSLFSLSLLHSSPPLSFFSLSIPFTLIPISPSLFSLSPLHYSPTLPITLFPLSPQHSFHSLSLSFHSLPLTFFLQAPFLSEDRHPSLIKRSADPHSVCTQPLFQMLPSYYLPPMPSHLCLPSSPAPYHSLLSAFSFILMLSSLTYSLPLSLSPFSALLRSLFGLSFFPSLFLRPTSLITSVLFFPRRSPPSMINIDHLR